MSLLSPHLIFAVNNSPAQTRSELLFCANCVREHERSQRARPQALEERAALPAFVARGRHASDTDQSSTVWFDVPRIASRTFHRGTLPRSSQRIFDGNISPDSVRYAVCADLKDDRNGAARLPAQEQEELLPPIQVGKEPEETVAQTQQQMEEETKDGRNCQTHVKLASEASLALTFGVLEAFDVAQAPFATFPANGHYRQRCARPASD